MLWEYKVFRVNEDSFAGTWRRDEYLNAKLDNLGNEGWELVAVSGDRYLLKRSKGDVK